MPARRRTGLWVAGVVGFVAVIGLAVLVAPRRARGPEPKASAVIDEKTPMAALARALRDSDARALAVLFQRVAAKPDAKPTPLSDAESAQWVEALQGMRTGFLRFGSYGRSSALTVVGRVLERFAAEPTPAHWV